jgi:hypothetical protein
VNACAAPSSTGRRLRGVERCRRGRRGGRRASTTISRRGSVRAPSGRGAPRPRVPGCCSPASAESILPADIFSWARRIGHRPAGRDNVVAALALGAPLPPAPTPYPDADGLRSSTGARREPRTLDPRQLQRSRARSQHRLRDSTTTWRYRLILGWPEVPQARGSRMAGSPIASSCNKRSIRTTRRRWAAGASPGVVAISSGTDRGSAIASPWSPFAQIEGWVHSGGWWRCAADRLRVAP